MSNTKTGFKIPKELLIGASGISSQIVSADERKGVLLFNEKGEIWYHDALAYVFKKWQDGVTEMYPPISEDPENSFAARIISRLDDQIAEGNLELQWHRKYTE